MADAVGLIERIFVYPAMGARGIELAEARCIEGHGLEGDCYAGGDGRQVSLLTTEARRMISEAGEAGLCFPRFRENLLLRLPEPLSALARLCSGEVTLEVSAERKRCHAGCSLREAGAPCPLAGAYLFARVVKGGVLRPGERVVVSSP